MQEKEISNLIQTDVLLNIMAELTTLHDIDEFELSMLKTLAQLLNLKRLEMYKLDDNGIFYSVLEYPPGQMTVSRSSESSSSQPLTKLNYGIEVPEHILLAQKWIDFKNEYYFHYLDGMYQKVYPVRASKDIVGYLSLEQPNKLAESDNLVISNFLSITHNFLSLLEESQKDKLTNLLNRKTFDEQITKIQTLLNKYSLPLNYVGDDERVEVSFGSYWLAIIDIDHFKKVNDNFGHVYGDEVLLLMATIMKKSFRTNDLLFRFGGEEFVVIMRTPDKAIAEKVLERFRKTVASYKFPQINSITVSLGATQIDETHSIPADIVGRADQALYYAKEHGRNQLHFYEALIQGGEIEDQTLEGTIELF